MEALTGKKSRKRKNSSSDASQVGRKFKANTSSLYKEIIPHVFKDTLSSVKRKVHTEHLLNPDEVEAFKSIPCDTEAALLNLRASFPIEIF